MAYNNKLGELRPNQIITTFGPGSVVDAAYQLFGGYSRCNISVLACMFQLEVRKTL